MSLEGTPFTDQRQLLRGLGWIVPFRFKVGKKIVKPLVSQVFPPFVLFSSLLVLAWL